MRSHRLWRALSERRGEGYVDVIVLVLCAVMVLALAMRVLPIFIQKQQLDTFATELVREAEKRMLLVGFTAYFRFRAGKRSFLSKLRRREYQSPPSLA